MADTYGLTLPQRDLWLALQLGGGGHTVQILDAITGPFDVDAWRRALEAVAARHDALRTTFELRDDGEVVQTVSTAAITVEHHDARDWSPDRVRALILDRAAAPFDLASAPLLRTCAIRIAGDHTYLLQVASHLVLDGAALGILHGEIMQAYTQGAIASRPPSVRYRDFVALEKQMLTGRSGEKSWAYWQSELAGTSLHLDLPLDRPRPARRTGRGAAVRVSLDTLNDALTQFVRTRRSTSPRVLLAAFAATLHRYSGATDFTIGCPVLGRPKLFEQMLGTFDNVALLRVQIDAATTFLELVTACTRRVAGALEHQLLPLAAVAERFQLQRGKGAAPFDVMFNVNRALDKRGTALPRTTPFGIVHTGATSPLGDARMERCAVGDVRATCDLAFQGVAYADGLKIELEYDTDVFDASTIERFVAHFSTLLEAAMTAPEQPIAQLPLAGVRTPADAPRLGGFAIDCAAIERILVEHPSVEAAAVVVRDGMLLGYLSPRVLDQRAVRAHLASRVAGYLVPAALVTVDAIDREALPAPDEAAFDHDEEPASSEERRLAELYRRLLGVARVGRNADFVALGGNSLLAIRLVAEIERTFEVRVPVSRVFEHPTIEALATFVQRAARGEQSLRVAYTRTGVTSARATVPQEYFYYLDVDDRDPASYCATFVAMIEGPLDAPLLARAYREVVGYHGIYRTALCEIDGVLHQTVLDHAPPELEIVDAPATPREHWQAELQRASAELVARGYDLAAGRGLIHSRLVRLAPELYALVDVIHHVAMDGASVATLRTQLLEGYARLHGGAASALPAEPPLQYIDFAEARTRWMDTPAGRAHQDFWASRVRGAPPLVLEGDFPRAPIDARRDAAPLGITADFSYPPEYVRVPEPVYGAITAAAREARTTPFVVFLGGLAWLLHERSTQTDLTIQSSYTPRAFDPALATINGCLTSWSALRIDLAGATTPRDAIARTKAVVELVHDHGAPHDFYRLVPHTLRRMVFNYVPAPRSAGTPFGNVVLKSQPWPFPPWKRPWDLHLSLVDDGAGAWLVWTGFERLFRPETVVALRDRYIAILAGV